MLDLGGSNAGTKMQKNAIVVWNRSANSRRYTAILILFVAYATLEAVEIPHYIGYTAIGDCITHSECHVRFIICKFTKH